MNEEQGGKAIITRLYIMHIKSIHRHSFSIQRNTRVGEFLLCIIIANTELHTTLGKYDPDCQYEAEYNECSFQSFAEFH